MLADAVSICTRNSTAIPCRGKRHIRTYLITNVYEWVTLRASKLEIKTFPTRSNHQDLNLDFIFIPCFPFNYHSTIRPQSPNPIHFIQIFHLILIPLSIILFPCVALKDCTLRINLLYFVLNKDKSPMQKSELESVELELSDAKKAVRKLASKIEEANLRSKGLQRKPKWREQDDPETSSKNEDARYTEVMKELEHMKQELGKLKIDMARVQKEKRRAERSSKASSSKRTTLLASMELMKKELQELNEKQALVDFAVKECESVESNELQITVSDVNLVKQQVSPLNMIIGELDDAKRELASVKGEGFKFMTSMDVIRDELRHVRDETYRLQKAEQKRDLNVQNLNSKILRAKAKLESLTSTESKTNTVASNLAVTLEQLTAEAETARKDREIINEEIENMNGEISKTELEIDVTEERLEEAMEELKAIKSSEAKALGNLRNLINKTVEARDEASMITITNFEYEYLTGKAGGAAELADKKIAAAQAWVEALKANERELLMKIEMAQKEISELSVEVDLINPEADADGPGPGPRLQGKVVASPRRSMGKVGNRVSVKRARLQRLRSPAARYSGKSGSMQREKVTPKLTKLFSKKHVAMDEGVV
ncbi:hypothetical protein L1987_34203 [Smallanthus sonchifolius]|uniref:Uncharacterized protein n=1 Tax=Smallanthus sonchifolius TaxID=185202 RepID=A0ACB9HUD2_9ASTR|nr:hypothetical protein L1987_34203 [Smallanthus sonchifolius]